MTLPPMAQMAPAKKPFYKKISTWVLVAIIAIVAVVATDAKDKPGSAAKAPAAATNASNNPTNASNNPTSSPTSSADVATATIGTPVTSGPFELTVAKVEKGVKKLGSEPITTKAQGQFIVISMTVKNVGDKAEYFLDRSVKLISADAKEYSVSSSASIYLGESSTLFAQINPGNMLTGKMAFDVPEGVDPATLEFSGALFGRSVEVALK